MGLEPTAFGTTTRRSNQLSYTRHKTEVIISYNGFFYKSLTTVVEVVAVAVGMGVVDQVRAVEVLRQGTGRLVVAVAHLEPRALAGKDGAGIRRHLYQAG